MKDNRTNHASVTGKIVLIGVELALLYWILESVVEVFVFRHEGDFFYQLFPPVFHVIWHRVLVVSLLIIFSVYAGSIITERKRAEEELKKYSEELEQSNMLKDLFIDIMRHDLLGPAGVPRGLAEVALMDEEDPDKKELLQTIFDSSERLIARIENASMLAKLESGEKLEFKESDLGAILRDAAMEMAPLADEKKVKVKITTEGEFPALVNPLVHEVFSNLISNAIKYGWEDAEVVVGIEDSGSDWKISVADNGPGIPDEHKESVFERFKRIKKGAVKGTGLGLAIVKRVVDAHKGRVWVEDTSKGGSVFYVTLPKP